MFSLKDTLADDGSIVFQLIHSSTQMQWLPMQTPVLSIWPPRVLLFQLHGGLFISLKSPLSFFSFYLALPALGLM